MHVCGFKKNGQSLLGDSILIFGRKSSDKIKERLAALYDYLEVKIGVANFTQVI